MQKQICVISIQSSGVECGSVRSEIGMVKSYETEFWRVWRGQAELHECKFKVSANLWPEQNKIQF